MKLLRCLACKGEVEILANIGVCKKIKCMDCGFDGEEKKKEFKDVEVIVVRKRG